ncbi:class F sortase [Bacillus toyonensis]|uniref:class F sortase n=1 Tax=Bacillus toyonensis TaxID=155322 RepID=UPI000BFB41A7|nr:class F sortase [Bacillus toyonensis]PHG57741.1 hypothetical protein COI59_29170 [Bacillus toyonensis]
MKKRLLLALTCLLILGIGYYIQQKNPTGTGNIVPQRPEQPVLITPIVPDQKALKEKKASQNISSPPVKMEFLHPQVTVDILPVGLDSEGRMNVKDGLEIASWYKQSAIPGNKGNTLLAGHRDWNGELGPFQYLETIEKNEKILIQYENKESRLFQVVEKQEYPVNEVPTSVMDIQEGTRVTLITCTGKFIREKGGYQSRVIVTLRLV